MFDWDDIRLFLAVAQEGSTLGASRRLNINQTTVSRRIQALEQSLKLTLFERDPRGYAVTAHGSALLDLAGQMAASAETIQSRAERLSREVSGIIRLTGNPEAMEHWGFPILTRFRAKHPDIEFEVDISSKQLSLEKGEADIALRAADEITGDTLVARKLALIPWGVYCSRHYERENGAPHSLEACQGHKFILYNGRLAEVVSAARWLADKIDEANRALQVNSVTGMIGSLRSGAGLGLLPCVAGDFEPDLVPCFRHEKLQHTLWVVTSKEAYALPPIRSFMKFVGENIPHGPLWEPV
ncbi:HTH-type transcriptional regulator PgrR (plasmid) [Sulfitobacter indolifex]|uniref:LysR family transcriptional regulator n=1 Tax=Sulfitobacter indolifex TaxID=225422 RepID=UPI001FAC9A23|nr:LysR family transcriptional regulator [Sulfitobacter indolifex]UOA20470.1 HTH-type transcriptional regulator PgrR [Sulfitobacter indolifex]